MEFIAKKTPCEHGGHFYVVQICKRRWRVIRNVCEISAMPPTEPRGSSGLSLLRTHPKRGEKIKPPLEPSLNYLLSHCAASICLETWVVKVRTTSACRDSSMRTKVQALESFRPQPSQPGDQHKLFKPSKTKFPHGNLSDIPPAS